MKYNIELPFYLFDCDDNEINKEVAVIFNGQQIIEDFAVRSKDRKSTNNFVFTVDVEPGYYTLDICPKITSNKPFIALDDIFLKIDSEESWASILNYHSYKKGNLVNSNDSKILITDSPEDTPRFYGFKYATPAKFWWDINLQFCLELCNKDEWNKRYRYGTWETFLFRYNRIKSMSESEIAARSLYGDSAIWVASLDSYYELTSPKYL